MNRVRNTAIMAVLTIFLSGASAIAQEHPEDRDHHDNHHYVHHEEWRKGSVIRHEDWDRGERVDYHRYHLHTPPRGYEWRLVDGNYVMAEISTGRISTVIVAH